MTDDYLRGLAEKIAEGLRESGDLAASLVNGMILDKTVERAADSIAAVLAEHGVVDPEDYAGAEEMVREGIRLRAEVERLTQALNGDVREFIRLRAEVERLTAERDEMRDQRDRLMFLGERPAPSPSEQEKNDG